MSTLCLGRYMNWLIVLLLSISSWGLSYAQEASVSVRKAYLLAADQDLGIDNMAEQTFTPYDNQLQLGFQSRPVWLRFEITPGTQAQPLGNVADTFNPLILRMAPYVTDKLVLYEPDGRAWSQQVLGDRVVMGKRLCTDDTHCFMLKSHPQKPVTVYVQVFHQGVFSVRSEVFPWLELPQVVADGSSRISASLAIASSLLFMAFVLFVIDRNWLLFTYICFQSLVLVFMALTTGRVAQVFNHISPAILDELTHHFFNLRVLMFVFVGWAALATYRPNKIYLGMVGMLVLASIGSSLAIGFGLIHLGITVYLSVTGVNLLVQFYGVYTTPHVTRRIRGLLTLGYAIYVFIFLIALLVIFAKWIPPGSGVLVNNFADWRLNGGPAGVVIFLIIVIQQAERKSESSRLLGQLRVEAAQSIANQDKLTERLTLIDMLTHELKNPLGTIRFALASLKRQTRDEESNERVSRIDRSVERMNDLIEHVAHSNRIDRFELQEEKEPIDAMDVIEELMTEYEEKNRFQLHIPDGAFFYSNRQMLSLMLANLIANAYKYDAKARPIHIQVSSQADATVFKIVNSIDPSIQPDPGKFFQRYYRHDNVQSLPGMGIGLSLVESAALKIGAKVTFHIEATQVAFTVEVPL